jgi:type IV pilus assembly protein PilB
VPPAALVKIGFSPEDAATVVPQLGTGCEQCNGTGFRGRIALYEVMEITDQVRELILVGASGLELRRRAIEEGMLTLRQSGLCKIKDGVTTIEEVLRETIH